MCNTLFKLCSMGALVAAILSSCSSEDFDLNGSDAKDISFHCGVNAASRAASTELDMTNFTVYGYTSGDGNTWASIFDNEKFTKQTTATNGENWVHQNVQYWKNANYYKFHAVAQSVTEGTSLTFATSDSRTNATINYNLPADASDDLIYAYNDLNGNPAFPKNGAYDPVNLTFNHLLSRIKIEFVSDDEVTTADTSLVIPSSVMYVVSDIKLTNIYKSGTLDIDNDDWSNTAWRDYTSGGKYESIDLGDAMYDPDGSLLSTVSAADESDIAGKPYFSAKNCGLTEGCYVIPTSADEQDYQVTFSVKVIELFSSGTHKHTTQATGTIILPKQDMKLGYGYVYAVTLDADKIDASNGNITFDDIDVTEHEIDDSGAWVEQDKYLPTVEVDPTDSSVKKVQKYDLLMSDGTFVSIHDDDGNLISKNQLCKINNHEAKVRGIVFYVGELNSPNLSFNSGLAVALNDATDDNGNTEVKWCKNTSTTMVDTWRSNNNTYKSYSTIVVYDQTSKDVLNVIQGYNNSLVLRAYNSSTSNVLNVTAIQYVDNYASNNPIDGSTTSGWYLGCVKEMVMLCRGYDTIEGTKSKDKTTTGNYFGKSATDGGTVTRDSVNTVIDLLYDVGVSCKQLSGYYWTSSECDQDYAKAVVFYDLTSKLSGYIGVDKKGDDGKEYIRPICAF